MTATKPTLPPEVAELATVVKLVGSCVYFLLDGEEVVYVGSSKAGSKRIGHHIGKYIFDSVAFLPVEESERLAAESGYIRRLLPKYNDRGTKEPVRPIRVPRAVSDRVRRVAAYLKMTPGDCAAGLLGPALDADEARMLADIAHERK